MTAVQKEYRKDDLFKKKKYASVEIVAFENWERSSDDEF